MERRNGFEETMTTLGTLIFGALIGVVVGLLMAPKPGVELRKDLADEATRMSERLSEASQDLTDTVKTKLTELEAKAEKVETEETADEPGDPA